jgi:hypothetical protein
MIRLRAAIGRPISFGETTSARNHLGYARGPNVRFDPVEGRRSLVEIVLQLQATVHYRSSPLLQLALYCSRNGVPTCTYKSCLNAMTSVTSRSSGCCSKSDHLVPETSVLASQLILRHGGEGTAGAYCGPLASRPEFPVEWRRGMSRVFKRSASQVAKAGPTADAQAVATRPFRPLSVRSFPSRSRGHRPGCSGCMKSN